MSRRKKNKRRNKTVAKKLSAEQLTLQAQQALSTHHYKLAIQHLKALLKKSATSAKLASITALLQQAYTGRAKELAALGMLKEAVTTWDVATQYGLEPTNSHYLGWIISSKQYFHLGKVYQTLSDKDKGSLQPKLAANCLSGDISIFKILPKNDPIFLGYQAANTLLEAWCSGVDKQQLQLQMKAISFRSPYRDLRQVIQAWIFLEESPQQVEKALARIDKTSPFYPLVEQIRLAELDSSAFLIEVPSLTAESKNCALQVRRWSDPKTAKLVKKLAMLGGKTSLKTLSSILFALGKQLDAKNLTVTTKYWLDNAIKKLWAISSNSFILDTKKIETIVGELTELEYQHYTCLREVYSRSSINRITTSIIKYLKILEKMPNQEVRKADRLLLAGLINRYLVDRWKAYDGDKLTEDSLKYLEAALKNDPSDDVSWLELLEYHLQQKDLKAARNTLKTALTHHPEHIKILDVAVRIAIKGDAFVKAGGYAKRILAVDPINSTAQQRLQYAHLSHAQKQFKQKKWHLVNKELTQALQWKGSLLTNTLIEVLQAYQIQAENGTTAAKAMFQKLVNNSKMDKVTLDFIFRYQAAQINQSDKVALNYTKLAGFWNQFSTQSVLTLIDIARQLRQINPKGINKPIKSLFKPLHKAAKLSFTAKEGEQICEFWMQSKENKLLTEYSNQLRKKYKDKPIFVYYYFLNSQQSFSNIEAELTNAVETAKEQNDDALVVRLIALLEERYSLFINDSDMFADDDLDNVFEGLVNAVDIMNTDPTDDLDEKTKMALLADLLPIIPISDLLRLADEYLEVELVRYVLHQYGEQEMRSFCRRCLKGEDPNSVMNDIKNTNTPFVQGF